MDYKIIITQMEFRERTYRISGLFRDGKLIDVRSEVPGKETILGNIYIGKVQNIVKNLNAAFIEIEPGVICYYSLKDLIHPCYVRKNNTEKMVQGDEVLVQVSREGLKTKAPSVTTNLTLQGRYVILTYENTRVGVSSKLKKETREQLKDMILEHRSDDFGIIVRTNAEHASAEEILEEADRLSEKMTKLISFGRQKSCFSCLYRKDEKFLQYIRNCYSGNVTEIVTDREELYHRIREYCSNFPGLRDLPVRFYNDPMLTLPKLYSLEKQLEEALAQRVWLKSGGYLVIQPTEALTVIDVNTGKSTSGKNTSEHFRKLNREAAEAAAEQIRLRNLSGIIVIDFIDMDDEADRADLLSYLRQEVRSDPVPVQVVDMTKLQLVELTRKKVEQSLSEQMEIRDLQNIK